MRPHAISERGGEGVEKEEVKIPKAFREENRDRRERASKV